MIKEAIEKVLDLDREVKQIEIDGRKYTNKALFPVKAPVPASLTIHTLSGIVDYLTQNIDALIEKKLFIHIKSEREVNIHGYLAADSFYERPQFINAEYLPPNFYYGAYQSVEEFIIGLQSYFVQDETTAALMKVVGNIKGEQVQQFSDDGQTQAITAKAGISTVATIPVPNPVTLRPFRTFTDIDQPASLFVFRMKQQQNAAPACGLWEADNGLWRVEAINKIAAWLKERLTSTTIRIIA